MKLSQLVGDRFKERPADCVIESHALMLRGGYMKNVAGGIYSQYPPLRRITRKLEEIIREEMDALGAQEVLFPVVLPASLWEESGRYTSVGSELMRLEDRNGAPLVLGMTHEEAAVHLVREYGQTYQRYPFMIYQIQTKFRDEARPRGGLIRVREFTMKDAYSFHTSQEDLEACYERCRRAYERIFARAGLKNVVEVASDSGMMGGSVSHEYMLLTPVGEDTLALCPHCDYKANADAAACVVPPQPPQEPQQLQLVHTPDIHTIEDICARLDTPRTQSCKAVVYQKAASGEYVVLFIRGDLDVSEPKLEAYLGEELRPAEITSGCGLYAGFIGPYGLEGGHTVLFDRSLEGTCNLSCGANRPDYHYTGLQISRDCGDVAYHDFAKVCEGGVCPECGQEGIRLSHGIEIGNIFQLGTKYTTSMNMQYVDKEGELRYPIMGCYGIGVGRLAAAVCEESRDEYGPIWPLAIAPWQVHLCCVRADDAEVHAEADALCAALEAAGIEVLYDDRSVSAGVMFSDADLLGIPLRVTVSPRNHKEGVCELTLRDRSYQAKAPLADALKEIQALLARL